VAHLSQHSRVPFLIDVFNSEVMFFRKKRKHLSFKERSLRDLEWRRKAENCFKIFLLVFTVFMVILVVIAYLFG
jgi:hypothetical protein